MFGSGIQEVAAFVAVSVEKAAILAAAALVYFLVCTAAAGCEIMRVVAATSIMSAIEGACEPNVLCKLP